MAAQLPLLVRGALYEGWRPAGKPIRLRTAEDFSASVAGSRHGGPELAGNGVVRAVFRVLKRHVSAGEVTNLIAVLPEDIQSLRA